MIRYLTFIFLLVFLLSACDYSSAVVSDQPVANAEKTPSSTNNSENIGSKTDGKPFDLSTIQSKYPLIWSGLVAADKKTITSENVGWSIDNELFDEKQKPTIEKGMYIDVDVMNCSGYIGSGKMFYKAKTKNIALEWTIIFNKEAVAADAFEKVKQCSQEAKTGDESFSSKAFAVGPQYEKRKNTKIGEVDTRKLFASLPAKIKDWANQKINIDEGIRRKDDLTLDYDTWTDIDGDGIIDLVELHAYNAKGTYTNGIILLVINNKWIEIAHTQPA